MFLICACTRPSVFFLSMYLRVRIVSPQDRASRRSTRRCTTSTRRRCTTRVKGNISSSTPRIEKHYGCGTGAKQAVFYRRQYSSYSSSSTQTYMHAAEEGNDGKAERGYLYCNKQQRVYSSLHSRITEGCKEANDEQLTANSGTPKEGAQAPWHPQPKLLRSPRKERTSRQPSKQNGRLLDLLLQRSACSFCSGLPSLTEYFHQQSQTNFNRFNDRYSSQYTRT